MPPKKSRAKGKQLRAVPNKLDHSTTASSSKTVLPHSTPRQLTSGSAGRRSATKHHSDHKEPGSAQFKSANSPPLRGDLIKLLHNELLGAMFKSNEVPFASSRTRPPLSVIQTISKLASKIPSFEVASYVPICEILNIVLGTTTRSSLFGYNRFIPYNKEMTDSIEGAVEVKGSWPELFDQAATYGRALFHTRKTRRYAVVIGINQVEKSLRFIFFHRGGRTSTPNFDLTNLEDVKRFYAILKGLQECQTSLDAGYVASVPELTPIWASATIIAVKTCIRGRGNYVALLRRCDNETKHAVKKIYPSSAITLDLSGVVKKVDLLPLPPKPKYNGRYTPISTSFSEDLEDIVSSFHLASMTFPPGNAVDNVGSIPKHLVVKGGWPKKDKMVEKNMFLQVSGRFGLPKLWGIREICDNGALLQNITEHNTSKQPDGSELRQHVQLYFETIGTPFFDIPTTKAAHLALIHGMIGHYILLKSGYLHRDISDNNVLGVSEKRAWNDADLAVLQEFGISASDTMYGMVIDGDLAVSLDKGNVIPTDGEISVRVIYCFPITYYTTLSFTFSLVVSQGTLPFMLNRIL
ncbi:hypothetical protein FRB94_001108 [Tulasnella sp. JGI-2019a]|nr:hypothetical protein FRB94_001108 [Tulasnella sp. JGI-2019a]